MFFALKNLKSTTTTGLCTRQRFLVLSYASFTAILLRIAFLIFLCVCFYCGNQVVNNPFDDIVPRQLPPRQDTTAEQQAPEKKEKRVL